MLGKKDYKNTRFHREIYKFIQLLISTPICLDSKMKCKKRKHLAMQAKLDFVPLFLGNKNGFLLSLP